MGFLDKIRQTLTGGGAKSPAGGGGASSFGNDRRSYWLYARCNRCGEPLKARIDTMNEPSEEDDGRWVVRKGLTGNGENYCFQTVEVTAYFDPKKTRVVEASALGGVVLSAEEYVNLLAQRQAATEFVQAEPPAENEA